MVHCWNILRRIRTWCFCVSLTGQGRRHRNQKRYFPKESPAAQFQLALACVFTSIWNIGSLSQGWG